MEANLLLGRVALAELMQKTSLKLQGPERELSLTVGATKSVFNRANGLEPASRRETP